MSLNNHTDLKIDWVFIMHDFKRIEDLAFAIVSFPNSNRLGTLFCNIITKYLNEFSQEEITIIKNFALSRIKRPHSGTWQGGLYLDQRNCVIAYKILQVIAPRYETAPNDLLHKLMLGYKVQAKKECLEAMLTYAPKTTSTQAGAMFNEMLNLDYEEEFHEIAADIEKGKKVIAAFAKNYKEFNAAASYGVIILELLSHDPEEISIACLKLQTVMRFYTEAQLTQLQYELLRLISVGVAEAQSPLFNTPNTYASKSFGLFDALITLIGVKIERYQELYNTPLTQNELIYELLNPIVNTIQSACKVMVEKNPDHNWVPEIILAYSNLIDILAELPETLYPEKVVESNLIKALHPLLNLKSPYTVDLIVKTMIKYASKLNLEEKNTNIASIVTSVFGPEINVLKKADWYLIETLAEYYTEDHVDLILNKVRELIDNRCYHYACGLLKIVACNQYNERHMDIMWGYLHEIMQFDEENACEVLGLLAWQYKGPNKSHVQTILSMVTEVFEQEDEACTRAAIAAIETMSSILSTPQAMHAASYLQPMLKRRNTDLRTLACETLMNLFIKLEPMVIQLMINTAANDSPEHIAMRQYAVNLDAVKEFERNEVEPLPHPISYGFTI